MDIIENLKWDLYFLDLLRRETEAARTRQCELADLDRAIALGCELVDQNDQLLDAWFR